MTGSLRLPNQWRTCVLGDLLQGIQTGKSVRCVERPPTAKEKGLVKISAVTRGEFDENESKTLLTVDHLLPSQKIEVGDLLFSRANTLELVGACAMVSDISKELYLSDKVLRLAMDSSFKPLVLRYLKTREARTQIESLATGNQFSMRNISQEAIRAIKLPLPPLAEQKVIADKLDTLLAQVENTKARLERIPQILKRFRQSVLAAAVSGRLTEEWRNGDNRERSFKKLGEAGVDVKTGPFGSALHKSDYVIGGIPVINPMHISEGTITPSNSMTISQQKYMSLEAWHLRKGDVVVGRRGEMGRASVVTSDEPQLCGTGSMILRVGNDALPKYLEIILRSPTAVSYFNSASVGSTMVNLNQKVIKNLEVYFPSLDEQTEIVRRVDHLFAHADRIEQQINNALARVNNLTQSILAKAFRGELTEQWRKDNPELISGENSAEALLERIKAERAAVAKPKRRKTKA
ncbi:hypothetical protein AQ621_04165 [Marinobacter sp. P4B1]|nr:hypothetical protein AQ621_04165 [Marinobacter sp. P4B1]